MSAQTIINQASVLLHDADFTRWTELELLAYLNDGQLETAAIKPDVCVANVTVSLSNGTRQAIPADGTALIDVIRNASGRAIRIIQREMLDSLDPSWHASTASTEIQHYAYTTQDPKTFYVYPPAKNAQVDLVYARIPPSCALSSEISIDAIYAPALLNYVLYRAYSKDSEYAGNKALAETHYGLWMAAITGRNQSQAATNPNAVAPATPLP